MGVAGIKWGQRSSTIPPFLMNLNEEALMKVSFKNIDWFQICTFSKTTGFLKKALKTNKFWKIQIFFCISGGNFIGLFNGILFVFILSVVVDTQKETPEFYGRKISFGHHCTAGIIQLTEEFEFPAKIAFANKSMIIDLRLRF